MLLSGSLGAGKSVLARGIAGALGAPAWRGSPTYNLVHEYATEPPLYHADLYRLGSDAVEELGLEEYSRPDSILLVEWPERAPGQLELLASNRVIRVDIEPAGESARVLTIEEYEPA